MTYKNGRKVFERMENKAGLIIVVILSIVYAGWAFIAKDAKDDGWDIGYHVGYAAGYEEGYDEWYSEGWDDGWRAGYNACMADNEIE